MSERGNATKQQEPNWAGYSDKPIKPGYPLDQSLDKGAYGKVDDEDLKRGFQKP